MSKALKCRAKKYPEYVKYEYEKVLDQILVKEHGRLNHPVFFLFLPYYLFIELLDLVWLKKFSESIRSIFSKSSKIRQRHSDFFEMIDAITTSEKITKKRLALKQFPGQMRKLLTDLNPLDDFRYFLLLYILFSALRKQLCHQSYALCMKFLPLMRGEFSPVMMSYFLISR